MTDSNENLAAIDLGTNSCRLRICDSRGYLIYNSANPTKLGEGLQAGNLLSDEAMHRALNYFMFIKEKFAELNITKYRAIATAACRTATNGKDFARMVYEQSSIKLDIISAYEEAVLNLRGAQLNADKNNKYILVYDLGGGSTEITLATNTADPQIIRTISVPFGARNAAEQFDICEYKKENASKLRTEIAAYVQDFVKQTAFEKYREDCSCIATSSTPLRLMSMIQKVASYDKYYADGYSADVKQYDEQIFKVWNNTLEQMRQNPCIGENRAPIFVAACIIFKTIYDCLGVKTITASLKGALDAIIADLRENQNG